MLILRWREFSVVQDVASLRAICLSIYYACRDWPEPSPEHLRALGRIKVRAIVVRVFFSPLPPRKPFKVRMVVAQSYFVLVTLAPSVVDLCASNDGAQHATRRIAQRVRGVR